MEKYLFSSLSNIPGKKRKVLPFSPWAHSPKIPNQWKPLTIQCSSPFGMSLAK
jgi:hypothetical protein